MPFKPGYQGFIEKYFQLIDKESNLVPFKLNPVQEKFLLYDASGSRDVILKPRQLGFSSEILGIFTTDFLVKEFSHSVIVADSRENAEGLLERVKLYVESYEQRNEIKIPMKYNTRNELYNFATKAKYTIGTAQNVEFGRSKTISNLHLSEAAFFPNMEKITASALQALSPSGRAIIETTANGYNFFRDFWIDCIEGRRNFKPTFYGASEVYDKEFLATKRMELGRMYSQEYPETWMEAFLASGDTYFERDALQYYLENKLDPEKEFKSGMYDFLKE